jgi:hypothetical protein
MVEFTDEERRYVIRLLREAIDADRFRLSDRVKALKSALAKLEGREEKPLPPLPEPMPRQWPPPPRRKRR